MLNIWLFYPLLNKYSTFRYTNRTLYKSNMYAIWFLVLDQIHSVSFGNQTPQLFAFRNLDLVKNYYIFGILARLKTKRTIQNNISHMLKKLIPVKSPRLPPKIINYLDITHATCLCIIM